MSSPLYSLKEMVFDRLDYNEPDALKAGGVSLKDRPCRARTAYPADPFKELGHSQSDHVNALVGNQLDAHDEWKRDRTDAEYLGRLGWKNWYFPSVHDSPLDKYPGQVDLIDMGDYWYAKTRAQDVVDHSDPISVEIQSTAKLEESGTYRVSGVFDNIKWYSFSTNSLRQEEMHVYVLQSETGYLQGVTQNTFAFCYHTGGGSSTDSNAIPGPAEEQINPLPIDYTFEMTDDLPYVTFIVRQMSLYHPVGPDMPTTESEFKNFKVEKVA